MIIDDIILNMDRNKQIIRTSYVGIAANVLLASFKAGVGLAAGSVAIMMDAVNNLTDMLSAVITIVGTKLSGRPADHEHPFGHGRIEYFTAIIIAVIVLVAGVGSLIESVRKIIEPTVPQYSLVTLTVIVAAIAVKLVLGRYVKQRGEQLKSDALIASGADALFDAVVTLGTLLSAGIMLIWDARLPHQPAAGQPHLARVCCQPESGSHELQRGSRRLRHYHQQLRSRHHDRLSAH